MKRHNQVIAFLTAAILLLTMGTVSFAAEQTQVEYHSAQELAAAIDAELEQQGVTILGGKIGKAYLTTTSNLKESPYVEVIWRIGYQGAADGLTFYTQAYSTPLIGVKLKSMSGHHYWKVIDGTGWDGDKSFSVRELVPERKIHDTTYTSYSFSSGTELECEAFVDVGGVGEIIGGDWYGSDTVTIP